MSCLRWLHTMFVSRREFVAAIDDLNTAVAALQTEDAAVEAALASLNTSVTTLTAAVAAAQAVDPAISAAAAAVQAEVAKLQSAVAPPAVTPGA